ncbi:CDP-glycerol glycerophosphotransferase family protein [Alkalimonas amylolytica]|uniref:CDP-glycerol glycerophosphotransferase n=1 Tax=Alkalimonas amylolytica TaxID=152573 RepID=A0A1H4A117_ALKAM|nr:CDP-glycerol glycerophosphotransferase family protein [Alkalimonas amylolytica]SEA29863.1 CDP-glycerol glycerophosphotransferase [Alkalimonas amylolytica]
MKKIHININDTKNYHSVQQQVVDEICGYLPDGENTSRSINYNRPGAVNISLFVRHPAEVYVGHNLADKNYLWSKTDTGDRFINQFELVFVPGAWLKKRLLQSKTVRLHPSQIVVAGSPRVDYLKRLQSQMPAVSGKLRVLWAPGHDNWKDKDGSAMGSYPQFQGYLDKLRRDFEVTSVVHPRNRKDKTAITEALLQADVVISDFSSVIYEAWALGKPVIFPRWLLGDKVLKRAPTSAEAYIFAEGLGYHPQSMEELIQILQQGPVICERTQQFIEEYIYQDDHLSAGQIIAQHVINLADADSKAGRATLEATATSLLRQKEWLQAEQAYRQLIEQSLGQADYYRQLALCLNRQNKTWQEVEALTAALAIENLDALLNIQLAQAQEKMRRYREAAQSFAKAIELDPKHQDVSLWYFQQAAALQQCGEAADGMSIRQLQAQAIASDKMLNSAELGLGIFYQALERWHEGYRTFVAEISAKPGHAVLHAHAAYCAMRSYQWADAVQHWQLALAMQPTQAEWHYRLAISYEQLASLAEAADAFALAVALKPEQRYWHYRYARCLTAQQRWQEALQVFAAMPAAVLTTTEDKATDALVLAAVSPARQLPANQHLLSMPANPAWQQKATAARDLLRQQLQQDTVSAEVWFGLAQAHAVLAEWPEAAEAAAQAIARSAEHQPLYFELLAACQAKQGLQQQACHSYLQCYNLEPPFGDEPASTPLSATVSLLARYAHYRETLPLQPRCIVYESFNGNGMSCNPYGLFVELLQSEDFAHYTHVWVINDLARIPQQYRQQPNIVFVPKASDLYLRYIASAAYLINNSGFPPYFSTRPDQRYLATWHGTPLKTLGKEQKYKFFDHKRTQRNFLQATHLITPNPHTTGITINSYDLKPLFQGKLAETGYPRIDRTLNLTEQEKQQLKISLGLQPELPVVLYAPTWRGTLTDVRFDTRKLADDMTLLSQQPCQLLFRGHSLMEALLAESALNCQVVPESIDTNELLAIVDVLITDYSSIFFDFLPRQKPILYYAYDLAEYEQERGLYFGMEQMPGALCQSIDELSQALQQALAQGLADQEAAFAAAKAEFCPHEDGRAAVRVIDFFMRDQHQAVQYDGAQWSQKIALICPGSFAPNGITSSFQNLLAATGDSDYQLVIPFLPHSIESVPANLEKFYEFPQTLSYLPRYGSVVMTLQEREVRLRAEKQYYQHLTEQEWRILAGMYARDFTRIFGPRPIDVAIHFSGYDLLWANLFAFGQQIKQRVIYLHNDLHAEWQARFPYLQNIFHLYRFYHKLVSVSEQTSALNQQNLAAAFGLDPARFCFSNNLQDPERVKRLAAEPFELASDQALFRPGCTTFITMGRLSVEKDHHKLIEAFSQLHARYPATQLIILGSGPLQSELSQQILAKKLQGSVHLLGQRKNPFPLLKAADCFVLSSNHEGQPMVLFEAMILQKPILSTDITGSRSALQGRTGTLVENSVAGLLQGMELFLTGQDQQELFDIQHYQQEALAMFYRTIAEDSDASE